MMRSALSPMDQHQTRGGAGIASGRSLPAADQCQDWPRFLLARAGIASFSPRLVTRRGFGLGALSHSHPAAPPRRGRAQTLTLPVGSCVRPIHKAERVAAARCVSARGLDCRPTLRNRLAHQPIVSRVAAALVHHRRLSSCLPSPQHGRRAPACDHQFSVMRCPE